MLIRYALYFRNLKFCQFFFYFPIVVSSLMEIEIAMLHVSKDYAVIQYVASYFLEATNVYV